MYRRKGKPVGISIYRVVQNKKVKMVNKNVLLWWLSIYYILTNGKFCISPNLPFVDDTEDLQRLKLFLLFLVAQILIPYHIFVF